MIYAMIQAIIQAMHAQVLAQLRKDLKPRYRQHSSACLYGFEPFGKLFLTGVFGSLASSPSSVDSRG